jgi:rhamnose utilization protein RhaD (predicted bifunctional aldolase and dehydrogenase)/NAD(P)-dependent dehydrogenase (short-subunit alcohol dehydrogenase family)
MQSLWNDHDAAQFHDDLGLRVYTSRLLGREPTLVLHGGGNTSVKIRETNLVGAEEDILYIKGSGWDLASIQAPGFAPVRMGHMLALAELEGLSDLQMVNELKTHLTRASAPTPSVETILHAVLPHKYVDHTHADVVVTITNSPRGEERIRQIYGESVVVVPYVMPGFELAREVAAQYARQAHPGTRGVVLMNHGLLAFGTTARESYERMIELVTQAEEYLKAQGAWELPPGDAAPGADAVRLAMAELRRRVSQAAGVPMVLTAERTPAMLAFARRADVADITQRGPATPDHVIRTKRTPLLGRDVADYATAYERYFALHAPGARTPVQMLDPAPRVILDPVLGLVSVGRSARDAAIVADIYRQTATIIQRAEPLGGWQALPPEDLFAVEYWELEQAKLRKAGASPPFAGEVVLVTGAASGIGRACVEAFRDRGAAVIGLDVAPGIAEELEGPDRLGRVCDVTDPEAVERALEAAVERFGGLDMLVLNAGVFPAGTPIATLPDADWARTMAVNLDANLRLLRQCHPLLKLAPRGGRVAVIGSKNVPAPGPGAAAYSASKAALTQLARVAALEWARDGIRINTLHPDAVFDTGIWTDAVLAERAAHYGLTVAEYKRSKTLLKVQVASRDVAELAAALCGALFAKTTGAQIPVDGGNERVV